MSEIEKQDLVQSSKLPPREAVPPRLHPTHDIEQAIQSGDLRAEPLLQSFAYFAVEGHWQSVWNLADSLKREVSILFDAQGLIWVDIGTIGMVHVSPPIGSELPLRLWVHTHPWNAYWSETDCRALAGFAGALEEALVLGHDHLVRSIGNDPITNPFGRKLSSTGPLMYWTDEEARSYREFREVRHDP
jgi:hypothetical protein|tara:strand:+ start:1450 stop:2013 length:564 start_codon:yes stop_codon:yes gene_type:complete